MTLSSLSPVPKPGVFCQYSQGQAEQKTNGRARFSASRGLAAMMRRFGVGQDEKGSTEGTLHHQPITPLLLGLRPRLLLQPPHWLASPGCSSLLPPPPPPPTKTKTKKMTGQSRMQSSPPPTPPTLTGQSRMQSSPPSTPQHWLASPGCSSLLLPHPPPPKKKMTGQSRMRSSPPRPPPPPPPHTHTGQSRMQSSHPPLPPPHTDWTVQDAGLCSLPPLPPPTLTGQSRMQSSAPSTGSLSASIRSAEWSEVEEEEEKNKKSKALSRMIDEMKGMRATEEGDGARFDSSMSTPICPLLQTAGTNVWPTAVQLHTRLYGSKDELEKTATFILQTGASV